MTCPSKGATLRRPVSPLLGHRNRREAGERYASLSVLLFGTESPGVDAAAIADTLLSSRLPSRERTSPAADADPPGSGPRAGAGTRGSRASRCATAGPERSLTPGQPVSVSPRQREPGSGRPTAATTSLRRHTARRGRLGRLRRHGIERHLACAGPQQLVELNDPGQAWSEARPLSRERYRGRPSEPARSEGT